MNRYDKGKCIQKSALLLLAGLLGGSELYWNARILVLVKNIIMMCPPSYTSSQNMLRIIVKNHLYWSKYSLFSSVTFELKLKRKKKYFNFPNLVFLISSPCSGGSTINNPWHITLLLLNLSNLQSFTHAQGFGKEDCADNY